MIRKVLLGGFLRRGLKCRARDLSRAFSASENKTVISQRIDGRRQSYELKNKGGLVKVYESSDEARTWRDLVSTVVKQILPEGYPYSVGKGYDRYVISQGIAMTLSTVGGVLSTQSLLLALGMQQGAIPLAASLNWIIKDGFGYIGGIIFSSVAGQKMDGDPKRWRMFSAISLDISCVLEIVCSVFPQHFLPLASLANIGKNCSYLAASASRAAVHESFATHGNLGDLTAKAGAQATICSLAGTGLGIGVASLLSTQAEASCSAGITLQAFMACSSVHLLATYFSLRQVTVSKLNIRRFDYLCATFLEEKEKQKQRGGGDTPPPVGEGGSLLTPAEVMQRERWLQPPKLPLPPVILGSDLTLLSTRCRDDTVLRLTAPQHLPESQRNFVLSVWAEPGSDLSLDAGLHLGRTSSSIDPASASSSPSPAQNDKAAVASPATPTTPQKDVCCEVHLHLNEGATRRDLAMGLAYALQTRRVLAMQGYGCARWAPTRCESLLSSPFLPRRVREVLMSRREGSGGRALVPLACPLEADGCDNSELHANVLAFVDRLLNQEEVLGSGKKISQWNFDKLTVDGNNARIVIK
jgi:hypothetical protein